jgi:hypothetical protein
MMCVGILWVAMGISSRVIRDSKFEIGRRLISLLLNLDRSFQADKRMISASPASQIDCISNRSPSPMLRSMCLRSTGYLYSSTIPLIEKGWLMKMAQISSTRIVLVVGISGSAERQRQSVPPLHGLFLQTPARFHRVHEVHTIHRAFERPGVQHIPGDKFSPGRSAPLKRPRPPHQASHWQVFVFEAFRKTPADIAAGSREQNQWLHFRPNAAMISEMLASVGYSGIEV